MPVPHEHCGLAGPTWAGRANSQMATKIESTPRSFSGWWQLFFLWIAYTMPIGFAFYGPAVLYPVMIKDLDWSRAKIMTGSTGIMLLLGLAAPLAAWMIGRFGARVTLALGGAIVALASFLIGLLGHVYAMYLTLSLALGLGICLATMIPIQTVAIAWFHERRALALGLVLGGGAIGGFLAPQAINQAILGAGEGWRIGWYMIAGACVLGVAVALLAVRNRPSDVGQHPYGLCPEAPGHVTRGEQQPTTRTYRTQVSWTLRAAVKTPTFWLLIVAVAGNFSLWQIVMTQGPLHLQDRGFDAVQTAFFYSLAIGLSIAGRFTTAALGDTVEPRHLFALGACSTLIGGILFWFVSPSAIWTAYLYSLLTGFGFGASYVCVPTIIGNYWGPEAFPGVSGLISPAIMVFEATAAPLAGFLYDIQGSYIVVMVISWVGAALSLVAILLCTPPRPRNGAGIATWSNPTSFPKGAKLG